MGKERKGRKKILNKNSKGQYLAYAILRLFYEKLFWGIKNRLNYFKLFPIYMQL